MLNSLQIKFYFTKKWFNFIEKILWTLVLVDIPFCSITSDMRLGIESNSFYANLMISKLPKHLEYNQLIFVCFLVDRYFVCAYWHPLHFSRHIYIEINLYWLYWDRRLWLARTKSLFYILYLNMWYEWLRNIRKIFWTLV